MAGDAPIRVLVLEDSKPTRQLLDLCFDKRRYALTYRLDGVSGLETALSHDFDLLLLDIGLPGMDGWEVLKRIREHKDEAELPVIVLTAHHDTVLTKQGPLFSSIDGFLPKPFDVSELDETVERVVGNRLAAGNT